MKDWHTLADPCRGTRYGGEGRAILFLASSDPKAESRRWLRGKAPFVLECRKALRNLPGSSGLSRSRKEPYRDLVVGSTSDPLGSDRLVDRRSSLVLELGARFGLLEQFRVLAYLTRCTFSV